MPALSLAEAVHQAQDAISGGNYRAAVDTCRWVLNQFPNYVTAHRLLGEAYLEQRDTSAAERAFQETIRRDPQNLQAYVGLGLIARERDDARASLAYLQAAWENAPQRADLREHVVRLSQEVYGADGRLQLTRAGLCSLHYHAGRWGRAVSECAAVLADHPGRIDIRLRLAAALWRRGEDDRAAATCRAVLEQAPQAATALLILADIERRRGNTDEATALRDRARAVDPAGTLAAELIGAVGGERAEFLLPETVPMLEEQPEAVVEPERPYIAPAPDFSAPAEPTHAEPAHAEAAPESLDISLPSDEELESARPSDEAAAGYTGMLRSLEGEGLAPFNTSEFDAAGEQQAAEAPAAQDATEQEAADVFGISSDQEIAAARPPEEQPHGFTGILRSLEDTGLQPFSFDDEPPPPWLLEDESDEGFDEALSEEPAGQQAVPGEPEPSAEDVAAEPPTEPTPLATDWDSIDDEIRSAIPGDMPRGFTDQLRSLDATGVEPFTFDDEEIPFFQRQRPSEPEEARETGAEPQPELPEDLAGLDSGESLPPEESVTEASLLDEDELAALGEGPAAEEVQEPASEQPDWSGLEDMDDLAATAEAADEDIADLIELDGVDWAVDEFAAEEASVVEQARWGEAPEGQEQPEPELETAEPVDETIFAVEETAAEETVIEQAPAVEPPATSEVEAETGAQAGEIDDLGDAQVAIDRLGVGPELFERARASKESLVESGQISGDVPFAEADEPVPAPSAEMEAPAGPLPDEPPSEPAARLAYADRLVDAGRIDEALDNYRWVYRHAPDFSDGLLAGLHRVLGTDARAAALATTHNLLGAIYRRRGEVHLSSRHYAAALASKRRGG